MTIEHEMRSTLSYTPFRFAKSIAAVMRHDEKVGKGRVPEVEESKQIVSQAWRSGGGMIERSPQRATLVRHIIDPNYEGFGPVARRGQALE